METKLNNTNFQSEVLDSQLPVLVDFWAQWCAPCLIIAPILSELAKNFEGKLKLGKLNVDENPDLAQIYHIRSIPNLKIFKNGQVVEEIIGALPKNEIVKRVEKHL